MATPPSSVYPYCERRQRTPTDGPAHTHVERFTRLSIGLRACSGVNVRAHSSLLVREYPDVPADVFMRSHPAGLSLHVGHLIRSIPFSPFWRGGLHSGCHALQTACEAGELHDKRVQHAGNSSSEGIVSCKTPTPAPASDSMTFNSEAQAPTNSDQPRPRSPVNDHASDTDL